MCFGGSPNIKVAPQPLPAEDPPALPPPQQVLMPPTIPTLAEKNPQSKAKSHRRLAKGPLATGKGRFTIPYVGGTGAQTGVNA